MMLRIASVTLARRLIVGAGIAAGAGVLVVSPVMAQPACCECGCAEEETADTDGDADAGSGLDGAVGGLLSTLLSSSDRAAGDSAEEQAGDAEAAASAPDQILRGTTRSLGLPAQPNAEASASAQTEAEAAPSASEQGGATLSAAAAQPETVEGGAATTRSQQVEAAEAATAAPEAAQAESSTADATSVDAAVPGQSTLPATGTSLTTKLFTGVGAAALGIVLLLAARWLKSRGIHSPRHLARAPSR